MRRPVIYSLAAGMLGCLALAYFVPRSMGESENEARLDQIDERSSLFRSVEINALSGSIESTDNLIEFYSGCHHRPHFTPAREKECISKFEYWTKTGLENGSPVAAQRQMSALLISNSCYDVYRAEYLYTKIRDYFRSSPSLLESAAEEISRKKQGCAW